jgi:16S rRNA processing protein RimM
MGRIAAPYGVKGWLKVLPSTSEPEALLTYGQWWLRPRGSEQWNAWSVQSGRRHGNTLVAQLQGLTNREQAAAFAGGEVGVARSALPAAGNNEYYWADLVGFGVRNREGELLGTLSAIEEFGAHPVMRVQGEDGAQRLIPFVPAYIDGVDVAGKRIDVDWRKDY